MDDFPADLIDFLYNLELKDKYIKGRFMVQENGEGGDSLLENPVNLLQLYYPHFLYLLKILTLISFNQQTP